jgi:hypothetical protein
VDALDDVLLAVAQELDGVDYTSFRTGFGRFSTSFSQ